MGFPVVLQEFLRREVGIDLGGVQRGVTQQLLHGHQVGTLSQHVGGERVAQDVRSVTSQVGQLLQVQSLQAFHDGEAADLLIARTNVVFY